MTMLGLEHLSFGMYEFTIRLLDDMRLPAYKGNMLRGGFGHALRRAVCPFNPWPSCKTCDLRERCVYISVFEPRLPADMKAPSGFRDPPRPYVFKPPLDNGRDYHYGDRLVFRLVLVGRGVEALPYFVYAIQSLGEQGLGKDSGRFTLDSVSYLSADEKRVVPLIRQGRPLSDVTVQVSTLEQIAEAVPVRDCSSLTLRLVTLLRLKSKQARHGIMEQAPPFSALIQALIRRLGAMSLAHSGVAWENDFYGWISEAESVRLVQDETRWMPSAT
jgi:hypothetical protein